MRGEKKCLIITSGHLVTSPRVVREADVLCAHGYQVLVISVSLHADFDSMDVELHSECTWQWSVVDMKSLRRRVLMRLRRDLSRYSVSAMGHNIRLDADAHSALWRYLKKHVSPTSMDVVIAHNLPGLMAGWMIAKQNRAKLVFDAEDWHPGELSSNGADKMEVCRRLRIIKRTLADVSAVIASSPGIAALYETYTDKNIVVVLNTERSSVQHKQVDERVCRLKSGKRSCFWYSQTVGPGRGLEQFIKLTRGVHPNFSLHLQGRVDPQYKVFLSELWKKYHANSSLSFIPYQSPRRLVSQMSHFDLGLASELTTTVNRDVCITNKILSYVHHKVPVIASHTNGQQRVVRALGPSGKLIDLESCTESGAILKQWLLDGELLADSIHNRCQTSVDPFNFRIDDRVIENTIDSVTGNSAGATFAHGSPRLRAHTSLIPLAHARESEDILRSVASQVKQPRSKPFGVTAAQRKVA